MASITAINFDPCHECQSRPSAIGEFRDEQLVYNGTPSHEAAPKAPEKPTDTVSTQKSNAKKLLDLVTGQQGKPSVNR